MGEVSNVQDLLSQTPTTAQRYVSRINSSNTQDSESLIISSLGQPSKQSIADDGAFKKKKLFDVDEMSRIQI